MKSLRKRRIFHFYFSFISNALNVFLACLFVYIKSSDFYYFKLGSFAALAMLGTGLLAIWYADWGHESTTMNDILLCNLAQLALAGVIAQRTYEHTSFLMGTILVIVILIEVVIAALLLRKYPV